ncbi:MAG: hypothetical protein VX768_02355, partial [Planctomycetota bacterium]|nr:hypothetical protein [Planctomycetota bacterium]
IFGFSKTLSRQHLVDSIGTTEKQVRELEKIRKEAEEEIRKKVAEIRQRARQKMLGELGENQRKKVREFEGDSRDSPPSRL